MSSNGVIAISRRLFDSNDPFFGGEPFTRREAWQWMIAEAAWKPRTVRVTVGRTAHQVQLSRGQLAHSRAFMEAAWNWTAKKVRTFLDHLERDGRITREGQGTGQHRCTITICKYDEYQFGALGEGQGTGQGRANELEKSGQGTGQEDGQGTGQGFRRLSAYEVDDLGIFPSIGAEERAKERADENGQGSREKGPELEEGSLKKRKNMRSRAECAGFADWYAVYPKKKKPDAAERAYAKVIAAGRVSETELLERTKRFTAEWARRPVAERKYIPYPATWLNDGQYADEPDGHAPTAPTPSVRDPSTFDQTRWRQLLALHAQTGEWGAHWGPAPGAPGCLVPMELLQARSRSPPSTDAVGNTEAIH